MESKVIVIAGPTCSGKTDLALKLSEEIKTEIISADSRQIYKLLDIGTAKPSLQEIKTVPHHFISTLDPDQSYNAIRFASEAIIVIKEVLNRSHIPVVVGGSGLYIKSLVHGITDAADTDEGYRQELYNRRDQYGNEELYKELLSVDPKAAKSMLPQNWKRVIRALEVFHLTGKSISDHHQEYTHTSQFNFIQFGLEWERDLLYNRINNRVDQMIINGLIDEVKKLLDMGFMPDLNSLNTPGYKEIISFLNDKISLEEAVNLIKRNTRHYAKRQMTWFRADKSIKWIKIKSPSDLIKASGQISCSI